MEPGDARESGWVTVYEASTDYAADLVRDRLVDSGIPAVVLAHRDHAFHLTVGSMAVVAVRVPASRIAEARELLGTTAISETELTRIALAAAPVPGVDASADEPDDASRGPVSRRARRRDGE